MKKFILLPLFFASCATPIASDIQSSIQAKKDNFVYCYEVELNANHAADGRVKLKWEINPGGNVENIEVIETTANNPAMESCLVSVVKSIRFRPRDKMITIKYPFTFSRQKK